VPRYIVFTAQPGASDPMMAAAVLIVADDEQTAIANALPMLPTWTADVHALNVEPVASYTVAQTTTTEPATEIAPYLAPEVVETVTPEHPDIPVAPDYIPDPVIDPSTGAGNGSGTSTTI
jgi:hypothetical protein